MTRAVRRCTALFLWACAAAATAAAAYFFVERAGVRALHDTAVQRLEVYRGGLIGEIRRYDYLSSVLSLNGDLVGLLTSPDPKAVDRVNAYLETVARESQALDVYVMDLNGETVASSNHRERDSFVGMNFSFRPYFKDALLTGHGHYYGVGTVSNEPGYYFASRIYDGERLIGVATVKVSLHSLENSLQDVDEIALAVDRNGVVFLSSLPGLLFRTLEPVDPGALATLRDSRQYHLQQRFDAIGSIDRLAWTGEPGLRRFRPAPGLRRVGPGPLSSQYLLVDRPVAGTDWRIVTMTSLGPAIDAARSAAATAAFAFIALSVFGLYLRQRRRAHALQRRAKVDLERAYDDLENQVASRTEALREANVHLQYEVNERRKTEVALKNTFEELVHSGKMAALGQMAASVTHELNQPLAALRTLSDNAVVLLRRDRSCDAIENLVEISQLVARMGKITGELKSFARKSPAQSCVIDLRGVVEETVSLLRVRLRQEKVATRLEMPSRAVRVFADANRLEQVLVNLINNAIDAMRPRERRVLTIALLDVDGRATVAVRDTGVGLSPAAARRLFEPFFTTKAAGQGLGLGLPLSAEIVKESGGTLSGRDTGDGAEFVIELAARDGGREPCLTSCRCCTSRTIPRCAAAAARRSSSPASGSSTSSRPSRRCGTSGSPRRSSWSPTSACPT